MDTEQAKPRVVDIAPPAQNKTVTITIAAVVLSGTDLSRTGIRDCEVRSQCYAPGDHHSISVGLFASILQQDLDPIRLRASTGRCFVHMSWGFGCGGIPRFETRLILTEDTGAHVRFTHGLDEEIRLDQYMKNIPTLQRHPAAWTRTHAPEASGEQHCGEESVDDEVSRQIQDEILYRERSDAELRSQTKIISTTAQNSGPSGCSWILSRDVRRWYWIDRKGAIRWNS